MIQVFNLHMLFESTMQYAQLVLKCQLLVVIVRIIMMLCQIVSTLNHFRLVLLAIIVIILEVTINKQIIVADLLYKLDMNRNKIVP